MIHHYRKLKVWEQAHQWVLAIYEATKGFPKEERYCLTSQLRRAAVSVPTNIVEGCGRTAPKDVNRFIQIAIGSSNECEYLLLLSRDQNYLPSNKAADLMSEIESIRRQLVAFQRQLTDKKSIEQT